jgi:hypothetical protein
MARSRPSHRQTHPHQSAGEQVDSETSEIVCKLPLLEEHEHMRQAKLKALRHAARQGFDEIDQGQGIIVRAKKGLDRFFRDIEADLPRAERDCS